MTAPVSFVIYLLEKRFLNLNFSVLPFNQGRLIDLTQRWLRQSDL
jgi:hypothetical protein